MGAGKKQEGVHTSSMHSILVPAMLRDAERLHSGEKTPVEKESATPAPETTDKQNQHMSDSGMHSLSATSR